MIRRTILARRHAASAGTVIAVSVVAALAGCGSDTDSSSPKTAQIGQTLTVSANNDDPDSSDKVQVEITAVSVSPESRGTFVRFTWANTSKHSTALPQYDFVSVDASGAWHACNGFTTPDNLHTPTTGTLDPGQTVTVDAQFPGDVAKIYYSQGGFVTAADGTPATYASEIQDTWTAAASGPALRPPSQGRTPGQARRRFVFGDPATRSDLIHPAAAD